MKAPHNIGPDSSGGTMQTQDRAQPLKNRGPHRATRESTARRSKDFTRMAKPLRIC